MRYIILILITVIGFSSFSQVNNKSIVYQNVDSIVKLLESKINLERTRKEKLDSLNTSLKNQLIIYKAKEDYFASALEDQSNRFSLIVTVLIAFLGFISFSWYRVEKIKINNKFNSFSVEFNQIKTDSNKLNSRLCITAGNSNVLISRTFRDKKVYISSANYSMKAAREHLQSTEFDSVKDYTAVISNLKGALNDFTEIKKNNSLKDKLAIEKESFFENIEIIQKAENEEVKNICAEIRVEIINYLK